MTFIDRIAPKLENDGTYPTRWSQYEGQEQAVSLLQVMAASARARKEPMEHVLIKHPVSGIGKTALAHLVAGELRRPARRYTGRMKVDLARMVLAEMKDRDVLFYDEVHTVAQGGARNWEWLLTYMEDGYLPGPRGKERTAQITIIAATTEKLPPQLAGRFVTPSLTEYTPEQAARIVTILSHRILDGPKVTGKQARAIADACGGNPRRIRNMLRLLRDMVAAKRMRNGYDIPMLLAFQGISEDGLDEQARRYLTVLANEFQGQAGGGPLADRLGDVEVTEQLLMAKGYVAKTRAGRVLTREGIVRCQTLEEAS